MISVALGKIVGVLGNEARMVANKICGMGKSNPLRLAREDVEVTFHCRIQPYIAAPAKHLQAIMML